MLTPVIMPKLGESMKDGKIVCWRKKEGDKVKKEEILFEVTTDKVNFEVEATKTGYLRKILVPASDNKVPVLEIIGYISDSKDEPLAGH